MPVNIAELERRARRLLTPEVYDYYAGGAGRERTLRANVRPPRQYWLLPRVLRDVSAVDTSVRLPGMPGVTAATPVAIAPTGFQGQRRGGAGDRPTWRTRWRSRGRAPSPTSRG